MWSSRCSLHDWLVLNVHRQWPDAHVPKASRTGCYASQERSHFSVACSFGLGPSRQRRQSKIVPICKTERLAAEQQAAEQGWACREVGGYWDAIFESPHSADAYAQELRGTLQSGLQGRGNGEWEHGLHLINDISHAYARYGRRSTQITGMLDVLISYVKRLHSGNTRPQMTLPQHIRLLGDLVELQHSSVAVPEVLALFRQQALDKIGSFHEDREEGSAHEYLDWLVNEEWILALPYLLRGFRSLKWEAGQTLLMAVDVLYGRYCSEARPQWADVAELLPPFASFCYYPGEDIVDYLRQRPDQTTEQLTKSGRAAIIAAAATLGLSLPQDRVLAMGIIRGGASGPDGTDAGPRPALQVFWGLAVLGRLTLSDCRPLLEDIGAGCSMLTHQELLMVQTGLESMGPDLREQLCHMGHDGLNLVDLAGAAWEVERETIRKLGPSMRLAALASLLKSCGHQVEMEMIPSSALLADCNLRVIRGGGGGAATLRLLVEEPHWFCANRQTQLLGTGLLRRRCASSVDNMPAVFLPYFDWDILMERVRLGEVQDVLPLLLIGDV